MLVQDLDKLVKSERNENSRIIGEIGAEQFVKRHIEEVGGTNPQPIFGGPGEKSRSGEFDTVWSYQVSGKDASGRSVETTKYIVVEAKGGRSGLEDRDVGDPAGRRAYQGSREYYDATLDSMEGSSNAKARDAAQALREARAKNVSYFMAKTPIARSGRVVDTVDVQEFNLEN